MALQHLAPELLVHIFESLSSVSDIISLSLTCRYFHALLPKSHKLVLFFSAIDQEMGPLEDILQLLTQNDNEIIHLRRSPPLSFTLLTQATAVARVAQRFVELYPGFRWADENSPHRRVLVDCEARKLRRAVYRLWSYTQAFCSKSSFPHLRSAISSSAERLQLLRSWSTPHLLELEDFRCTLERLLAIEICPTDGEVYSRTSEDAKLPHPPSQYFPSHHFMGSTPVIQEFFHDSRESSFPDQKASIQELRFRHMRGWGSDLQNFYLVQSFLKFSPAQILWLFDNAVSKTDVERFIELHSHDPCFFDSGSLLFSDWVTVLHGRGVDVQEAREAIWDGNAGIVIKNSTEEC
ncbi:uncharacterized protein Z518_11415 [Rhinocladiella mackenziei CBS 650.93]|uniref:F-box domain-containing protein n=1 Tax=Rhinocladiella mackenziei CBS 650.93 TaxID=1442369 RepID=A0A0D2GM11_9EURO|nr:uncharacterized protein Z518_11415 [Rhinocladiella mackenziei CBS 650.93]KIW99427.1 hypothetical protein Z518_11415 [Rhinocladiella mackenziei CBS 650.93]